MDLRKCGEGISTVEKGQFVDAPKNVKTCVPFLHFVANLAMCNMAEFMNFFYRH